MIQEVKDEEVVAQSSEDEYLSNISFCEENSSMIEIITVFKDNIEELAELVEDLREAQYSAPDRSEAVKKLQELEVENLKLKMILEQRGSSTSSEVKLRAELLSLEKQNSDQKRSISSYTAALEAHKSASSQRMEGMLSMNETLKSKLRILEKALDRKSKELRLANEENEDLRSRMIKIEEELQSITLRERPRQPFKVVNDWRDDPLYLQKVDIGKVKKGMEMLEGKLEKVANKYRIME